MPFSEDEWNSRRPPFDETLAAALIGKTVLVGITYVNDAGAALEQRQFHGRIVRVSHGEGVVFVLPSGEEMKLPPHLDAFHPAAPGEYRLRSTGEVIVDPDYTTTWTLNRPVRH